MKTIKGLGIVGLALPLALGAADFDIRDYGAKPGDAACQTAAIQKAIDAAAQAGGGRVIVPKGTWMTGTITLRSHVELHLERDGVLLGSPNCADYPERPAESLKHLVSDMLPRYRNACMIWADEAEDIAITGPGTIDCNGTHFVELKKDADKYVWGWAYRRIPGLLTPPRVVFFAGCRKVRLTDHCMRNQPSGWSYWITDCDDVVCSDLRIDADVKYPNNDGLHINSSRNVRITNCDISCGDDAIVLRACNSALRKAENPPCANVTIDGCRLRSYSSAVRLAWIHDGVITNCVIRNTEIHDSSVGIGIALPMRFGDIRGGRMSDEGREATFIKDILVENVTMDQVYAHPLRIQLEWSGKVRCAGIRDVTFRNVTARSLESVFIYGRDEVSDFTFENCRFTICADKEFPMSYLEHGAAAWNRMKNCEISGVKNFNYVNTTFEGVPRNDYPIAAVPSTNVVVTGGHWLSRPGTDRAQAETPPADSRLLALAEAYALRRDPTCVDALRAGWTNLVGSCDLVRAKSGGDPRAALERMRFCDRMFRLRGEGKYVDMIEHILYNELPVPPQVAALGFATQADNLYCNVFMDAEADVRLAGGRVKIAERTDYPRDGKVAFRVGPEKDGQKFELRIRVPRWLSDHPIPGNRYWYEGFKNLGFALKVNGETVASPLPFRGYAQVRREWRKGDTVEIEFPFEPRRVIYDERTNVRRGYAATMRGPVVFRDEGK